MVIRKLELRFILLKVCGAVKVPTAPWLPNQSLFADDESFVEKRKMRHAWGQDMTG
jgi:hypothetical protein